MAERGKPPRGGGPRREWPDRDNRGPRRDDQGPRPDGPPHVDRRRGSPEWQPRRPPGGSRPPSRGPGGAGGAGPRRDGPPPFDRSRPDDRPQRNFEDRPRRDFGDRPQRNFEDRPRRDFDDRPQRNFQDRPRRDFGDRPQRNFQDRPPRNSDDRPRFEDRPQRNSDDRPRRFEDRPPRDFPRSPYPDRAGPRPSGGRPERRPARPYEPRRLARPAPVDTTALLGEDEELICGRHPVEEAFAARRSAVRLLIVPERRAALDALAIHATTLRIPVVEVEGGTLTALAGFDGHQGVALVARPRQTADIDAILAHARQRKAPPFVLVLDSLEDPQNFGTLLRSAEACGVDGVIYPTRHAAPLSPAAIKASAGATEHLLLAPVDDLAGTLVDLHGHGLRLVGADEEAALDYSEADLRGPLVLVVGSEGRGISGPVRRRLDLVVRIPMRGRVASLNAAVAGSILLFAAAGQRPDERVAAQSPALVEVAPEEPILDSPPAVESPVSMTPEGELLPGDS